MFNTQIFSDTLNTLESVFNRLVLRFGIKLTDDQLVLFLPHDQFMIWQMETEELKLETISKVHANEAFEICVNSVVIFS